MAAIYTSARLTIALFVLAVLAACQTPPATVHQGSGPTPSAPNAQTALDGVQKGPVQSVQDQREATDLRVFLADTKAHPGWTAVPLKPSGVLYVRTDALISRSDLMGIQSATDQRGNGLLVLILTETGQNKLQAATAANPGLRLALVVGPMMLAAPAYTAPIREQTLAFPVGSARNAEIAARSVAGVH